ncbi:sensor histidine kinase [Streptomyces sp. NRRL S-1868]|uniref:sensor histidine kinase n=1 Tax=Streptomyces sp. NRRL S-1868 TaxID=1463892 RepID=UPI00068E23E1|nr:HAMP domain-containing sensor histidine kinase [Streptomyces sp. NRRL S-1868]
MRRQLLVLIGVTTAVVLAVLLVPLALLVRSHAEDRAMTDATERAQSVATVVGSSLGRKDSGREVVEGVLDGLNGDGQPRASVVMADGTVLGRRAAGVSEAALRLARGGRAFTYAPGAEHGGGRVVLVPVLAGGGSAGASSTAGGSSAAGSPSASGSSSAEGASSPSGPSSAEGASSAEGSASPAGAATPAGSASPAGASSAVTARAASTGASSGRGAAARSASVVQVAVSDEQLHAGALPSWFAVFGLAAALMLLGLAFADRLAARLVRPPRRIAGTADRLAGGELTARAEPSGPRELRLLAGRLNELGRRIDGLVTAERERGADLAHRLRTPVAALRLDAEGLRDKEEAARIGASVAALERSVDGVIRAARRAGAEPGTQRCDLAAVTRERADFWTPLAEDQDRAVTVSLPRGAVPVRVAPDELAAVLDTLIGNVLDHTPEGCGLWLIVEPASPDEDGCAVLRVEDDGPGFDDDAVAERGASGAGSTGLGLDIARTAAEDSGGGVRLTRSPARRGAAVVCRFGPAG